jgi:RNA polymerase sigma-70 factor (ECF subfamily)
MDDHYIKRVTEGDIESFRFLVEKYQKKAFSVAFSIVHDQTEAEDVVQESFIKAYRKLSSFRGDSSFSTWLLRIVVNESIKIHRKKKMDAAYTADFVSVYEPEVNQSIRALKEEEQKKFITFAMSQMPAREALVLHLFYIEDMSLKQMEEILELGADHIKVVLFRARKLILSILQVELKHELKSIL